MQSPVQLIEKDGIKEFDLSLVLITVQQCWIFVLDSCINFILNHLVLFFSSL